MCNSSAGCTGDTSSYGQAAQAAIRAFVDAAPCIRDAQAALTVPVIDRFVGPQIRQDLWIANFGGVHSNLAQNPPSGMRALRLDGDRPTNPLVRSRITSNEIDLSTIASAELRCAYQHFGVASGDRLRVEVLDDQGVWLVLDEFVSDGTDPSDFEPVALALPQAALHGGTQVRWTPYGRGIWYVDDFEVDSTVCGPAQNFCTAAPNTVSAMGATLAATGSGSIGANDLTLVASSCPTQDLGIVIYGDRRTVTAAGDGFICVNGNPIYRLGVAQADTAGTATFVVDQTNLAPGSTIAAGDRINFQFWYRDATMNGFNFTDAASVIFCP